MIKTGEHIVAAYSEELEELHLKISNMGMMVEKSLSQTISIMRLNDLEGIKDIFKTEESIDEMTHQIKDYSIVLIARRQPVAVDLRIIISAIEIANNLERIGDLVENICRRIQRTEFAVMDRHLESLWRMAEKALNQLKLALTAYKTNDIDMIRKVQRQDDIIDEHYFSLYKDITALMQSDNRYIKNAAELLFIDKNLERIADHASNIAEIVFYRIKGSVY